MKRSYSQMMADHQVSGHSEDVFLSTLTEESNMTQAFNELQSPLDELIESVEENRPELFLLAMNAITASGEISLLTTEICCKMLEIVVDTGRARLLERMLQFPLFRTNLCESHFSVAIIDCLPDILSVMLNSGAVPERCLLNDSTYPKACAAGASITNLLLSYVEPNLDEFYLVLSIPSLVSLVCKMNIFPNQNSLDESSVCLKTLASLYFSESIRNVVVFSCILPTGTNFASLESFGPNRLISIFKNRDITELQKLFRSKFFHQDQYVLCALHLACEFNWSEAINALPDCVSITIKPHILAPLLTQAVKNGSFKPIKEYLCRVSANPLPTVSILQALSRSLNEMVLLGDINGLVGMFHSLESVKLQPLFESCFLRLVMVVLKGEWRKILLFMECFPERILLADAAWRALLDTNLGEQFRPFIDDMHSFNKL